MIAQFSTSLTLYLPDDIEADCLFEIETDTHPAEPYSWGGSRGSETDVSATLKSIDIDGSVMPRAKVIEVFGIKEIWRMETLAVERMVEA